ncbi:hypothetical protein D3C76_1603750 [compost metagenome]
MDPSALGQSLAHVFAAVLVGSRRDLGEGVDDDKAVGLLRCDSLYQTRNLILIQEVRRHVADNVYVYVFRADRLLMAVRLDPVNEASDAFCHDIEDSALRNLAAVPLDTA